VFKPLPARGPGEGRPMPSDASNSSDGREHAISQWHPRLDTAKMRSSGNARTPPADRVARQRTPLDLSIRSTSSRQDTARCGPASIRPHARQWQTCRACKQSSTRGVGVLVITATPHGSSTEATGCCLPPPHRFLTVRSGARQVPRHSNGARVFGPRLCCQGDPPSSCSKLHSDGLDGTLQLLQYRDRLQLLAGR